MVSVKHEKKKDFKSLGYVRLYRGFQDDPLYKKRRKFSQWEAWEYLYMNARGVDTAVVRRGRIWKVKRGQLLTTQRELAQRWGWKRNSVRLFLAKLVRRGSISNDMFREAGGFSILTLLKYEESNS